MKYTYILLILLIFSNWCIPHAQLVQNNQESIAIDPGYSSAQLKSIPLTEPLDEHPTARNIIRNSNLSAIQDSFPQYYSGSTKATAQYSVSSTTHPHAGTYAGEIYAEPSVKGTLYDGITSYGNASHFQLNDGISLNFWEYIHNPELSNGNTYFTYIMFHDSGSGSNYYLYYFLSVSESYNIYNFSNSVQLNLNQSVDDVWKEYTFDLTADFDTYFAISHANVFVSDINFYFTNNAGHSLATYCYIDDVVIANSTAFSLNMNGDFEQGDGSFWYSSPNSVEGQFITTNGYVDLSLTAYQQNTNGYMYFNQYLANDFYVSENTSMLDFDFRYAAVAGAGPQYARFRLRLYNSTNNFYIYIYLGSDSGTAYSGNSSTSVALTHIGSNNTWDHVHVDLYSLAVENHFVGFRFSNPQFYVTLGQSANSLLHLSIDNLTLTNYVFPNSNFEVTNGWQSSSPLPGWHTSHSDVRINLTNSAYEGTHAANISFDTSGAEYFYSQTAVMLGSNEYLDFYWKSISHPDNYDSSAALFVIVNQSYTLNYELYGTSSFLSSLTNSTYQKYILHTPVLPSNSWNHTTVDLYRDLAAAFGNYSFEINNVYLYVENSLGRSEILFDSIHILHDTHGPRIQSINAQPAKYYSATVVTINAYDLLSRVLSVSLFYKTTSSWTKILTTGWGTYTATIPQLPYGTNITFYVVAQDLHGITTTDDNGGAYYSLSVIDDIAPKILLPSNLNNSQVSGTVTVVPSVSDAGTGISRVEYYLNSSFIAAATNASFALNLATRTLTNGMYALTATAYDGANNSQIATPIFLSVHNDLSSPTISSVVLSPQQPEFDRDVQVYTSVADASQLLSIQLHYQVGNENWQVLNMTGSAALYEATIPGQPWNTLVSYYVMAVDMYGQNTTTATQNYTVGDNVLPVIAVQGPLTSIIKNTVNFQLHLSDEGSGINQITVAANNHTIVSLTSLLSTMEYSLDTTALANGNYSIVFALTDHAGNVAEFSLSYIVDNPEGLIAVAVDAVTNTFQQYAFVAGVISLPTLWVLFKGFGKLLRRRAKKGKK